MCWGIDGTRVAVENLVVMVEAIAVGDRYAAAKVTPDEHCKNMKILIALTKLQKTRTRCLQEFSKLKQHLNQ